MLRNKTINDYYSNSEYVKNMLNIILAARLSSVSRKINNYLYVPNLTYSYVYIII